MNDLVVTELQPLDELEGYSDLDRIIGELRGGEETCPPIRLYRVVPGSRKEAFLGNIPSDVNSALEFVQDKYGGGEYRIKAYAARGRGLRVNETILIDSSVKAKTSATLDVMPQQGNDVATLIAAMQESNRQLLAGIAAMFSQNQPHQPSRAEMLQEMQVMAEIMGGRQQSPAIDPMQVFGLIEKGMEFGQKMVGGGEASETGQLLGMAKDLLPVILGGAQQAQEQPQQVQRPMIPAPLLTAPAPMPTVAPIPSQPAQTTQGTASMGILDDVMLKQAITFLSAQAARGHDPSLYAEVVLDQAPQSAIERLVNDPNWLEELKVKFPAHVNTNTEEWFKTLRQEVVAMLTPEQSSAISAHHDSGAPDKPAT